MLPAAPLSKKRGGIGMDGANIIELLYRRDESAIALLRSEYGRICTSIAMSILSQPEDAEECVNTAFYEVWNRVPPDRPENLQAYLCRIVKNTAIDRCRYNSAEKRNAQFAVSLDELAECVPDAGADPDAKELAEAISTFLRAQEDVHRRVFVRRYWYGDTIAQIAQLYSLKEKTVGIYLFRTRKKLRTFLEKEGHLWIK